MSKLASVGLYVLCVFLCIVHSKLNLVFVPQYIKLVYCDGVLRINWSRAIQNLNRRREEKKNKQTNHSHKTVSNALQTGGEPIFVIMFKMCIVKSNKITSRSFHRNTLLYGHISCGRKFPNKSTPCIHYKIWINSANQFWYSHQLSSISYSRPVCLTFEW